MNNSNIRQCLGECIRTNGLPIRGLLDVDVLYWSVWDNENVQVIVMIAVLSVFKCDECGAKHLPKELIDHAQEIGYTIRIEDGWLCPKCQELIE